MGFSQEFTGMAQRQFPQDGEVMEVLKAGDRRKMAVLLLKRMGLSPDSIVARLHASEQDMLIQDCETAKPVEALLKRLLEYEMCHGFSVMTKQRQAPATMSEEDLCMALDAPL